jgi:hypothetical protein
LQNEEIHILYSSPNIIRQIKLRRMRWAGHVARMGEERKMYKVLVGKPKGKNHLEDQGVDGSILSEWILLRRLGGDVVWIQLAQNKGHWWAHVHTVMNLPVLTPQS